MTNPISDVLKAEVILTTGTNTDENHPIIANYVKEAVTKRGAKLLVIDPRRISLVDHAALWLRPYPGTDVAWINGLMHIIIKEGLYAKEYVEERTEGFEQLKEHLEAFSPAAVSKITGISEEDLYSAARLLWQRQAGIDSLCHGHNPTHRGNG